MDIERPLTRDLVLIGGGHTHALALRMWGMAPLPGARVTLINPGPTSPYTGMLPGYVAGHYTRHQLDIDLVRLARFAGARIVFDKAAGIDRQDKLVHLEGRAPIRYDIASLDIGVTADLPNLAGFDAHAHSVKPLGPFAGAWQAFLERPAPRAACVVIGGGVAGAEIALAMAHRQQAAGRTGATVTLLEAGAEILPAATKRTRRILRRALARYGVRLVTGVEVSRVSDGAVELTDGQSFPSDFTVSTAGARAYPWLAATGLALTQGFIDVGMDLRTSTDPNIFAVGDCAHLAHAPRPKAGVFAEREAPVLFHNLKAALSGQSLRVYAPQTDYLKLISAGERSAVAEKHSVTLSGRWLWSLKDRIDSRFMARLNQLPAMTPAPAPALRALDDEAEGREEMLCGGCGSKVGRDVLSEALAGQRPGLRADTLSGIGDDAAVLQSGGRLQVISTDHLRAFTQDPYLLAQIASVHALGDVWAMGAAPQAALLSITLPRMSERMQAATLSEIIAAVGRVLGEAGADLVGGHTSVGEELSVGLTVTGLLNGPAIGLAGARPGDALVLTKPIGTGVILAAEKRGLARGSDVASALSSMKRPLAAASRLLGPEAHAMTDVTGFGLAGHLMNLLEASGVAARLYLTDVPVLAGAETLSAQQVRSSIWRANARLEDQVSRPASALSDLLYDPQTAGGLLAAVPAACVPKLLADFQAAGEPAFVIGEILEGAPRINAD